MAFFKAFQLDSNKKWYPKAVQVDQPFTTKELADALAEISTVSYADVMAVLGNLPGVMGKMMAQGRSVRMEGLGTFRLTINAEKQGVDTADEVSDAQIKAVRIRFTPETRRPTKSGGSDPCAGGRRPALGALRRTARHGRGRGRAHRPLHPRQRR